MCLLIYSVLFVYFNKLQEGPNTVACELLDPRRFGRFTKKNVVPPRETSPRGDQQGERRLFLRANNTEVYYEITWLFFSYNFIFLLPYILLLILSDHIPSDNPADNQQEGNTRDTDTRPYQRVRLLPTSDEFKEIEEVFKNSFKWSVEILSIERVQNPYEWDKYQRQSNTFNQ